VRLRHTLIPGSARVPPAGERLLAIANFAFCVDSLDVIKSSGKVCFGETPKPTRQTRALPGGIFLPQLFLFPGASSQTRDRVFAIEFGDKTCADFRGANRFAFVGVRAIAETFCVHLPHHFCHPRGPFRCALRQKREMRNFAAVKSMADAFGQAAAQAPQPMHAAASIARSALCFGTGIEFASGAEPARAAMKPPACTNTIKRAPIDHQIAHQRKWLRSKRLHRNCLPSSKTACKAGRQLRGVSDRCACPLIVRAQVPQMPSRQSESKAIGA